MSTYEIRWSSPVVETSIQQIHYAKALIFLAITIQRFPLPSCASFLGGPWNYFLLCPHLMLYTFGIIEILKWVKEVLPLLQFT